MLPGVLTLPDSSQTSSYNRAGVSGLRTPPIAWCFLAWSSASCQLRTWRGNREENGTGDDACSSMVLLRSCLCSVACPPGPPCTPAALLHPDSSCGRRGWEALGFGIEHRVSALLIVTFAVFMARTCQQSPQLFPFGSKSPALSRSWVFGSRDPWIWRAGLSLSSSWAV